MFIEWLSNNLSLNLKRLAADPKDNYNNKDKKILTITKINLI